MLKLIMSISVFLAFSGFAQTSQEKIYKAYVFDDMASWKNTIDAMHTESAKPLERELELLNYEYGYIGWCIGNNLKAEARVYLQRGESRILKLKQNGYKLALLHAYQSAFYGYEIGLNKLKAPFFGRKSINEAKKSVEIDNNNYLGYIQLGNIEFYMPTAFGGSKKKSLEYYLKAEELMQKGNTQNNWNYLSLITQIAQLYEALADDDKAELYYKKALKIAPEFSWVKDELYPNFLKKKKR